MYDALVALTAKLAGAALVTAGFRATGTDEFVGVATRPLGDG